MRRAVFVVVVLAAAAYGWIACSTFGSTDTAADASSDATPPPDAADDGTVLFDDFEDQTGCGKWTPFISSIVPSDAGHASGGACLLCRKSDAGARPNGTRDFALSGAGSAYTLSFWAKPTGAVTTVSVAGSLILRSPDGGAFDGTGDFHGTSGDWTFVSQDFASSVDAPKGSIVVVGDTDVAVGECFLLDDVRLTRGAGP